MSPVCAPKKALRVSRGFTSRNNCITAEAREGQGAHAGQPRRRGSRDTDVPTPTAAAAYGRRRWPRRAATGRGPENGHLRVCCRATCLRGTKDTCEDPLREVPQTVPTPPERRGKLWEHSEGLSFPSSAYSFAARSHGRRVVARRGRSVARNAPPPVPLARRSVDYYTGFANGGSWTWRRRVVACGCTKFLSSVLARMRLGAVPLRRAAYPSRPWSLRTSPRQLLVKSPDPHLCGQRGARGQRGTTERRTI